MKTSKTIMLALAVAVATVAGNVKAAALKLNVSATVKYQNLDEDAKGTIGSHSFNEKDVYLLISNAVYNADLDNGYSSTLPKDGYIAFDPDGEDDLVDGTFYVTNKEGAYYPLSGFIDETYYSFIELDTIVWTSEDDAYYWGFYWFGEQYLFLGINSYNFNDNGGGSDAGVSKALLYIHDNPYDWADSNMGDPTFDEGSDEYEDVYYPFDAYEGNENAFEIGGILTAHFGFKNEDINSESLSLSGTGNFIFDNYNYVGVVSSGHASFNK